MKAIILAAGMGSRLGKYTRENTKCMLEVNGRTLIERALDALDAAGIRECVIVVGYCKENLMRFLGGRRGNINITYVANDVYNKTNNIYSLYLAKDHLLSGDTLLLESDLIFEAGILKDLLACDAKAAAVVAPYEAWMDGTMVQITGDNTIAAFIPGRLFNYNDKDSYYKTVNIYKFTKEFSRTSYVPFLEAYCTAMGNNEYYEQVLRVIAALDKQELKAHVLRGEKWYEIDDAQDKDIAETLFCGAGAEQTRMMGRRYGGYWRFPKMLDFCYLVNPYFPTPRMQAEMKAYFSELLTCYPSGLNVQNLLAGKLFNINDDMILAGNGAAELIRAIAPLITGRAGVIYPTFNEYPESLGGAEITPFYPHEMRYTIEDLLKWQTECDTLLLINPDNPSGNYIPAADALRLLAEMKAHNRRLLLDESFIDFADAEEDGSLLHQHILEEYPNLVVIKSLSKSYGIPGIRLGILASSDAALIASARKRLAIWNINSFAEYFLQIIGKYRKDYAHSRTLIAQERGRFMRGLAELGLFDVYPSQANYLMCRCRDGEAAALTAYLLHEHAIFIKDLSGKKGMDGAFIRIAVRGEADNNRLLEKLRLFGKDEK